MSKIIKYVSLNEAPHIVAVPFPIAPAMEETHRELAPSGTDEDAVTAETMEEEARHIIDEMMKLAHSEAETIRDEAKAEAQTMLDEAAVQAEDVKEFARNEGYKAGYEAGEQAAQVAVREEMANELQQSVAQAEKLIAAAKFEGQEMILAAERQIIEITLAIASKVLAREIEENPMVILPIVKTALAKVKDQDEFNIRVEPEDYEVLLHAKHDLQMMLGRDQGITITADRTLAKGDCIIETPYGNVDAKIDTQLENVKKALQGVMP